MTSEAPLTSCQHDRLMHLVYEARASVRAAYFNLDGAYQALAGANDQLAKYRHLLSGERDSLDIPRLSRQASAGAASSE